MRMPHRGLAKIVFATTVLLALALQAAGQNTATGTTHGPVVPQAVSYAGAVQGRAGQLAELTFRIYAEPEGGDALWSEVQRVHLDADGKYAVLLGAASEAGLPQTVFAAGQARWLGISVEGGAELARVPLASVAFAMKAADAETLAGVPAA